MPLVCPACNKADQAAPLCQRCGCDLTALHALAAAATSAQTAARVALGRRDWTAAEAAAARAWRLVHAEETAQLAFVAAAAAGATPRALQWRARSRGATRPPGR